MGAGTFGGSGSQRRFFAERRTKMVERQIAGRGISDQSILSAMRSVPRELFVGLEQQELAYDDTPLPIAAGQTISQPYIVALMIETAGLAAGQKVLDVGTGSGYAAAVMSKIAAHVYSIERHAELVEDAREALAEAGCTNVEVALGDGTLGWPDKGPFDAIVVAAGGPDVPHALLNQLAPGGRLVMPVGKRERYQHLVRVRNDNGDFVREDLGAVAFVPLIGAEGWEDTTPPSATPS
jgi:protein-L-isoaspartate(D-aspartate) O-methyltransferase